MDILNSADLQTIHIVLCLGGVLLSTHLMQLIWHNPEEGGLCLRWMRRINLALVAFAMLWSLSIVVEKGWQPWPPGVLLVLSVDLMMLIRVVVTYRLRCRASEPPYPMGVAQQRRVR